MVEEPPNKGGKEASTWLKEKKFSFYLIPSSVLQISEEDSAGVGSTLEGGRWASLGTPDILSTYPFSALAYLKKQVCVFGSLHA